MTARRVVAYLRVSKGRVQQTANQRPDLERLAAARGLAVDEWREETASAATRRRVFDDLMSDARRGRVGAILVWSIDRFGRSLAGNVAAFVELDALGVRVVSHLEPWLDAPGPLRGLLIAVFSWVAEQERARLIERTHAGLAAARRKRVRLGRPAARIDLALARDLIAGGMSVRATARALGCPEVTLRRHLACAEKGAPPEATQPPEDT